jgi:hypothetical protein
VAAEPKLSVVVTVVSDTSEQAGTDHLEGCLEALRQQAKSPPMEVLVTCDARLGGIKELEQRFPEASFIVVEKLRTARSGPSREHHDELRGIGMRKARAPLIALIEDVGRPDSNWAAAMVREHVQPYAAIGGVMENGIDRPLNWAVYFGDFGRYQNPVPRGPSAYVSDANVCYKREALERVADAWADTYSESRVHAALVGRGEVIALSPDVIVNQHRLNLHVGPALVERYVWGRSYAAVRVESVAASRRILFAVLCPLLPFVLLLRQWGNVVRTKRNRAAFLKALPLTFLLDVAWSWGEFVGYVTGHP